MRGLRFNFKYSTLALIALQLVAWWPSVGVSSGLFNMAASWRKRNVTAAWMGTTSTEAGGFVTGSQFTTGTLNGRFSGPQSVVKDSGGNIYVSDGSNRIMKFSSTGVFVGWIGRVGVTPTGGAAGCSVTLPNSPTPGWCTGGASTSGSGDGMLNLPNGLAADSGGDNLYVVETGNHRISRYSLSTGTFNGWIGQVGTSPSGGAAGCSVTFAGNFTPGWCFGGTSQSGSGDGALNSPYGIYFAGAYLYVADSNNHRVSRYDASGTFAGWVGKVGTTPGCSVGANTATTGWCSGVSAAFGNLPGELYGPRGVVADANYLYITDYSNHRVSRYALTTGAPQGWIGRLNGGGTCGSSGAFTNDWCTTSQTSTSGFGDGHLAGPSGISIDGSGNLYVVDANHRISRFNSSIPSFSGWAGKVSGPPSGGAPGCSGAPVGTYTPGWCQGGSATFGTGDGMLNGPTSIFFDSSAAKLLVTDFNNRRLSLYNSTSVVYDGSIGGILGSQTWTTNGSAIAGAGNTDGTWNGPTMAVVDPSTSNMYVSDTGNNRIVRYDSSGSFTGWIGKIGTTPTGGAGGCIGASIGSATPGWCTGGSSQIGSSDGTFNSPRGLNIAGGYLYVTELGSHRISKYNLSAGTFVGAIGKTNGPSTGTCPSSGGTTTWCTGGTFSNGGGDSMFTQPYSIALDLTNDWLFVADSGNNRISKYILSTGSYVGSIGNVTATSGTCTLGAATAWCTGGTFGSGSSDGMLNQPMALAIDGSGRLFVADNLNKRICQFDSSTGGFNGWIGRIQSTLGLSGGAGCSVAPINSFTPTWCKGGVAGPSGLTNGSMQSATSLTIDAKGYLYTGDTTSGRINKYLSSSGQFKGWMGFMSSSPTGGAAGCKNAGSGKVTPGWCLGGASTPNTAKGAILSATGLTVDSKGSLYLIDSNPNAQRITRFKNASP